MPNLFGDRDRSCSVHSLLFHRRGAGVISLEVGRFSRVVRGSFVAILMPALVKEVQVGLVWILNSV